MLHRRTPGKLLPVLLGLFLLVGCVHGNRTRGTSDFAGFVSAYAQEHHFSGTVLVAQRGCTLFRGSFGLAERAFAVPAEDSTRYRVASITKLFTSVLVLQLVDEGRMALDAPVSTYLPDYPGQGADRITIHHLLNHTSGLAQYDRVASLEEALESGVEQYQRPMTAAQLLDRCCSGAPAREPGSGFDYNNADYILLGRILERVAGMSYEALLNERILTPLGLADTGIAYQDLVLPRLAPTYYWRAEMNALINDLPMYYQNSDAAGAMYSTAADLRTFADALFGGRLLRRETLERMLTPGLDDYGYGLWSYSFTRGGVRHRVAKRPGSIMGANAVLYRLIDRDATIVLLANTNRADLDEFAQRIGERLVD